MAFSNWQTGQPDGGSQNCMVMYKLSAWRWHDTPCTIAGQQYGYICEISF